MCSVKKVFLKFSQKLHENTCARYFFFIKLQAWDLNTSGGCFWSFKPKVDKASTMKTTLLNFPVHSRCSEWHGISLNQKQPSRRVLKKRCSENMHQIFMTTPMSKCDFNKVASNFTGITLWYGCSPENLLHIFRIPFPKNTSRGLLPD